MLGTFPYNTVNKWLIPKSTFSKVTFYYAIGGPNSEARLGYGTKMMGWWQTLLLDKRAMRWSQILQKDQALLLDYASD